MKKKSYKVAVYLDENFNIRSTECECPRGEFKCSHAVAIFYKLHIPYNHRNETIAEEVKHKDFFLESKNGQYALKTRHVFWDQVQG